MYFELLNLPVDVRDVAFLAPVVVAWVAEVIDGRHEDRIPIDAQRLKIDHARIGSNKRVLFIYIMYTRERAAPDYHHTQHLSFGKFIFPCEVRVEYGA